MIGREAEISKLRGILYDVPLLGASFVALTGDPGIGKSTFIKHFIQNLPDWADGIVIRFSESRKDFFLQIARYLNLQDLDPSRVSIKFHSFLEKRRAPFVLAVDDVDFTYEFFQNFIDSLKTQHILVITAIRRGNVPPYFEIISLTPWSPEEIREFYKQERGSEPSLATLVEMEEITGGNPRKCREFLSGSLTEPVSRQPDLDELGPAELKKRAYELKARGRFEEAITVFNKLLEKVESPRERALLKLEIATNWSLLPDKVMEILGSIDRELLRGDEIYQFELLKAYVYSQKMEFEKTIDVVNAFLKGVKDKKFYVNALALRGEARYYLGDMKEAEADFREIIRLYKSSDEITFMAYRGLALIDIYRLNYARAMASIQRMEAIALAIQNFSLIQIARTLKASVLAKSGRLKDAEWILYSVIKLSRNAGINYSYAFFNSLSILMLKLDFKSAIHNMNHMLRSGISGIHRGFIVALLHLNLAKAYLEIGEIDKVEKHLAEFKALMPEHHAWKRVVENIERRLKVEKGEMVPVELSKSLTSDEVERRLIHGMILALQGKKSSARRSFISLLRKLEKKGAYDWIMKTAFIARRFFPRDPDFTKYLLTPERRREKFGLYLLGPFRIVDLTTNEQVFNDTLKSVKLREFISLLGLAPLINRDGRLSRFFIKERLWPYFGEERQNKNLSWVVSKFREIFGREGVVKEGDFYRLNRDLVYLDITDFLEFYRSGREADRKSKEFLALDNYRKAVNMVFGKPFEGLPVESCEDAYQSLMGMIEHSFERVCEISLVIGKTHEVREFSEFARNIFPFNENFYRYPVKSYLNEGRKVRARKELQIMKKIYESEFGEPFVMEIR